MFLPGLFSLPATEPAAPLAAFVARFYSPPGKATTTRPAVYVCRWDGTGRATVATPTKEPYAVFWSGPSRLVWLCNAGADATEVWTRPWPAGAASRVATLPITKARSQPGRPFFETGDSEWHTVTAEGDWADCLGPQDPFFPGDEARSKDGKWTFGLRDGNPQPPFVLASSEGQTFQVAAQGLFENEWYDASKDLLWVRTSSHDSTTGTSYWLYTLDWGTHRLVPRIEGYARADFWPSRTEVAYCMPRSLAKYGKSKSVWVSPLFVGDVRKVRYTKIVSGLVNVLDVALQPMP